MSGRAPCIRAYARGPYLMDQRGKLSERTIKNHLANVDLFVKFIGRDRRIDKITEKQLTRFENWWLNRPNPKQRPRSKQTARRIVSTIRSVIRHAIGEPRGLPESPALRRQRELAIEGSLSELLFGKYLQWKPDVGPVTVDCYATAIRHFDEFLGRQSMLSNLSDEIVNSFLSHRHSQVEPTTVNNTRRCILALWNFAWRKRLVDEQPRDVPTRKAIQRMPDAWTLKELGKLIAATRQFRSSFERFGQIVNESDYLKAWILVQYELGLRLGDMMALTRTDVANGYLLVHKNQAQRPVQLTAETLEAVDAIASFLPSDEPIFAVWNSKRPFYDRWHRLLELAGLKSDRRQCTHKVRRTSASHLESVSPGSAQYHLGHRTPGLAAKHYLDPRIVQPKPASELLPRPELDGEV